MTVQELGCSQLKKMDKIFSVGNRITQLFDISTIKAIELSKKITLKSNKFTGYRTLNPPKHILLNIIYEFDAPMNVYLNEKKEVHLITLSCVPTTHYLKAL